MQQTLEIFLVFWLQIVIAQRHTINLVFSCFYFFIFFIFFLVFLDLEHHLLFCQERGCNIVMAKCSLKNHIFSWGCVIALKRIVEILSGGTLWYILLQRKYFWEKYNDVPRYVFHLLKIKEVLPSIGWFVTPLYQDNFNLEFNFEF